MARKEKNIHYIYKTTCNVTGRWYIGMHSCYDINDGYMGSGTVLRRSIRKYGKENHTKEILEYCDTREILILRETKIVNNELISDPMCMNLKEGGKGGFCSKEHQLKAAKARGAYLAKKYKSDSEFRNKANINLAKGRKKANSSPNKKFDTFKGKTHSEESKKRMSEASKGVGAGKNNSQYGTCWITKDGLNKKIKKEELEFYLKQDWIKGRKMK